MRKFTSDGDKLMWDKYFTNASHFAYYLFCVLIIMFSVNMWEVSCVMAAAYDLPLLTVLHADSLDENLMQLNFCNVIRFMSVWFLIISSVVTEDWRRMKREHGRMKALIALRWNTFPTSTARRLWNDQSCTATGSPKTTCLSSRRSCASMSKPDWRYHRCMSLTYLWLIVCVRYSAMSVSSPHEVATSSCHGHVNELATKLFLLLHS